MSRIRTEYTVFHSVFAHWMKEGGKGDLSMKALARVTKIELRTLQAYRSGQCSPNEDKEARIVEALGSEFKTALEAARGYAVVPAESQIDPRELRALAGQLYTELVNALDDGQIDHIEAARLEPLYRRVMLATAGFVVKRRAA